MSKYSVHIFLIAAFILSACDQKEISSQLEVSRTSTSEEASNNQIEPKELTARLNKLYVDHERDFLDLNPFAAVFRNNMEYNDQWGDFLSDEYFEKSKALDEAYLNRLLTIDPQLLKGSDRVSYDIFKYNREQALESYANGSAEFGAMMPVNQMSSVHLF
ncbi:MAG: hypothetical protein L3J46_08230, partial [Kangiellaceae bacterium]|nr:hypothetical protein [Kangiellaceae bacterium]